MASSKQPCVTSWLQRLLRIGRRWRASWRPAWAMMPRVNATLLVETMLAVVSLLEREGLRYTVHYGCLLGATRLQGALPWDIDGDLFLVDENAETAAGKMTAALQEHGFSVTFSRAQYYFTVRPAVRLRLPLVGTVSIPLIPLIEIGLLTPTVDDGGRTSYDVHSPYRMFAPGELLPLRRMAWHDSYVMGPRDELPVLGRLYQEAASPAAFECFHRPEVSAETARFWRQARPLDGEPDFEAISRRCRQRAAGHVGRTLLALPWYLANGAYCIVAEWVRRRLGGHTM